MRIEIPAVLLVAALLSTGPRALSQSFNPTAPARAFNVFTRNAIELRGGDTHGPLATGGGVILKGNAILSMNSTGSYPTDTLNSTNNYGLVIGDRIFYNSGNQSQLSKGQIRLGNTSGTTVTYPNGNNVTAQVKLAATGNSNGTSIYVNSTQPIGSATGSHGLQFGAAFNTMLGYSAVINDYDALSSSALSTYNINKFSLPSGTGGTKTINISSGKLNYISISAATLQGMFSSGSTFIFSTAPGPGTLVVFNVQTGGSGVFNWSPFSIGGNPVAYAPYILYNFHGAQSINIAGSNSTYGTLFAPGANIIKTQGNNAEGQIVADSFTLIQGEVHYQPFAGLLPNTAVPLPLDGLSLKASGQPGGVMLSWNLSPGTKLRSLSLERSADGQSFEMLASWNGADAPSSFRDEQAAGKQYYRLRGVTLAGNLVVSNMAVSDAAVIGLAGSAAPNPFRDALRVSLPGANAPVQWLLCDMTGRTVAQGEVMLDAAGRFELSQLAALPAGSYLLRCLGAGQKLSILLQRAD